MAHLEELDQNYLKRLLIEQSSFADQKTSLIGLYQDFYPIFTQQKFQMLIAKIFEVHDWCS